MPTRELLRLFFIDLTVGGVAAGLVLGALLGAVASRFVRNRRARERACQDGSRVADGTESACSDGVRTSGNSSRQAGDPGRDDDGKAFGHAGCRTG